MNGTMMSRYLTFVTANLRIIAVVGVVSGLVGYLAALLMPPLYEGNALLAVTAAQQTFTFTPNIEATNPPIPKWEQHIRAVESIVSSNDVLKQTWKALPAEIKQQVGGYRQFSNQVRNSLSGNLIILTVRGQDARVAATMANRWAATAISHVNKVLSDNPTDLRQVRVRYDQATKEYLAAVAALEEYSRTSELPALQARENLLTRQLQEVVQSLATARARRDLGGLTSTTRELERNWYQREVVAFARGQLERLEPLMGTPMGNTLAYHTLLSLQALIATTFCLSAGFESEPPPPPAPALNAESVAPLSRSLKGHEAGCPETGMVFQVDLETGGRLTPAIVAGWKAGLTRLEKHLNITRSRLKKRLSQPLEPSPVAASDEAVFKQLTAEVNAVRARLVTEQARYDRLVLARDTAWNQVQALAAKVKETETAVRLTSSKVRLAAAAYPDDRNLRSKPLLSILAAALGLALTLTFLGVRFIRSMPAPGIDAA